MSESDRSVKTEQDEIESPNPSKTGKYYKQAYRKEWESMPDFQGWLRGVPDDPMRAYCTYCSKTLHAHRLSLLKHTCTLKHTKAAQLNYRSQGNLDMDSGMTVITPTICAVDPLHSSSSKASSDSDYDDNGENDTSTGTSPTNIESQMKEIHSHNVDGDSNDKNEASSSKHREESQGMPPKKIPRLTMANPSGSPLSTHVLDTAKGRPVSGLHISLYKLVDGRWTNLKEGITNPDGRFTDFIKREDFTAGRYKMHFDVDRYFEMRRLESLYPFIEIVFDVKSPADHYHVPLLLSPFGYTTYRGS